MKKGIRGHDVRATGVSQIREKMTERGIEYIQLVMERSVSGFTQGSFTKEYAQEIKEALGDIKIAVLGSYINPSEREPEALGREIERFKEKIRFATVLGPLAVATETGIYHGPGGNDGEEAYRHVFGVIRELAEYAREFSVNIAIEGVGAFVINSPEKMHRLVSELNFDNVKVIFDPVNYIDANNYLQQDEIINKTFELLSDKLVAFHAKDFRIENGGVSFPDPGLGDLNYPLIFENMKKYGVDIPIIMEGIDEERAAASFARLEEIRGCDTVNKMQNAK